MIQRIQTVYLALSVTLIAVFLLIPLFDQNFLQESINIKKFAAADYLPVLITGALLIVAGLAGIFTFRNRPLQGKIIWLAISLNILLIVLLAYWYAQLFDKPGKMSICLGAFLPVITLVLNLLAVFAVKKDDRLVKSLDRLR